MILNSMIGTVIVLVSFCMGYWLRAQQTGLHGSRSSEKMESEKRTSRPQFKHTTPFTSILTGNKKGEKGK